MPDHSSSMVQPNDAQAQLLVELCSLYSNELRAGRKGNVKQLVERMPQEGRSDLLRELFAIRCEYLGGAQIDRIAEQWQMAFPDFRLKTARPAGVSTPTPLAVQNSATTGGRSELPLDLLKRIDAVCLRFEEDLKSGREPDVTRLAHEFPRAGRSELLAELLRIAVEYRARAAGNKEEPAPSASPLEQTLIAILKTPVEHVDPADASPVESETQTYAGPVDANASTVIGPSIRRKPGTSEPVLADFELLEELGRGGMGVVYKARQISLQRLVALKMVLRAEFASPDDLVRFRQEAESAAQLDHPGIVPVFEVGETGGLPYFSMAFVEGPTLSKQLLDGPLGVQEAAELVRALAVAVAYAHGKGIVHRDLKPGNVLLDNTGKPRITDFGLAKRLDSGQELTTTGQIVGTPSYMPPEQARGLVAEIDRQSDIYSLGAVLYACLTGRPPFQAANPIDTLQQVMHGDPVRPALLNKSIPRGLEIICLKCLSKRKKDRYETAAHLALDLGRWQKGEPIHARPINRFGRAWMWCRRRPALAAAASVAVVASIGFLIAFGGFVRYQAQTAVTLKKTGDDLKKTGTDLKDREQRLRRTILEAQCDLDREFGGRQVEAGEALNGVQQLLGAMASAQRIGDAARQQLAWGDLQAAMRQFVPLKNVLKGIVAVGPDGRLAVQSDYDQQRQRYFGRLIDLSTGNPIGNEFTGVTSALFAPDGRTVIVNHKRDKSYSDPRELVAERFDTTTGESLGKVLAMYWPFSDDQERQPGPLYDLNRGRRLTWDFQKPGMTIALMDIVHDREIAELAHPGTVTSAAFSPDRKLIVTGCGATSNEEAANHVAKSGKIFLWDAETGRVSGEPLLVEVAAGFSPYVDFSPDGKLILARTDWRGAAQVWDLETRKQVGSTEGDRDEYSGGGDHRPPAQLSSLWGYHQDARFWPGKLSRDGKRAFIPFFVKGPSETDQNAPAIYEYDLVRNQRRIWPVRHQQKITTLAVSPDGSMLLTGSGGQRDQTAILWDTQTGQPLRAPFRHAFDIRKVGFIPHRPLVYVSGDGGVQLWNLETGLSAAPLILGNFKCVSPDGNTLVTGYDTVQVWDLTIFDPPTRLPVAAAMMTAHPDGSLFIVENSGNTSFPSGPLRKLTPDGRGFTIGEPVKLVRDYSSGQTTAISVTPDGKELWASVHSTWSEYSTQKQKSEFQRLDPFTLKSIGPAVPSPIGSASLMAFSPDGRRLAVGSAHQQAHVLDATTGQPLYPPLNCEQRRPRWGLSAMLFNDDGSQLHVLDRGGDDDKGPPRRYSWALSGLEWTRRIVPATNGDAANLPSGNPSPLGKFLLTQGGELYDRKTQQKIGVLPAQSGHEFGGFLFAAEDRVILKLNAHSVQGFDTATAQPFGPPVTLESDTERKRMSAFAVDPDRKRLMVVSIFHEGRIYDMTTGKQIGSGMGGTPGAWKLDPRPGYDFAPKRPAAFSPDGRLVILPHPVRRTEYRTDIQARIWNMETQTAGPILAHPDPASQQLRDYHGANGFTQEIVGVAFRPDSQVVATAAKDEQIRLWDVTTGKPVTQLGQTGEYLGSGAAYRSSEWGDAPLAMFFGQHFELVFSGDGRQLLSRVTGSEQNILWDVATGCPAGYPVQAATSVSLNFQPDNTIPMNGAKVMQFNGDAAGNSTSAASKQLVSLPIGEPLAAALSPDGSLALLGGKDGMCWLLDAASGRPLGPPIKHDGPITAVAWSPDGQTVWTACADRTLRSFRAPTSVPTDSELVTAWIHVHTGYSFHLPELPQSEIPLDQLTLQRGRGIVSAPSTSVSEDWWRQQRKKLQVPTP